jgi:hypothetical protein
MSRELSSLDQAYRDRGLSVIGADPYDWDSSRFLKFYSVNKPSYPLLMVTHRAQLDYGIVAYPMIYLLDEHRKVIYRSVGYSEAQALKLQSVIESHLK